MDRENIGMRRGLRKGGSTQVPRSGRRRRRLPSLFVLAALFVQTAAVADTVTVPLMQYGYGGLVCMAMSRDGTMLLTGSADHKVRLWNVDSGKVTRTFTGHTAWVYSVAVSPDGKLIASGGADSTARLWNAATGDEIPFFGTFAGCVCSVAFSPDGTKVLVGSGEYAAKSWNIATGEVATTFTGHTG